MLFAQIATLPFVQCVVLKTASVDEIKLFMNVFGENDNIFD